MGALKYFLGIEVARSKHGIFISQRKYVLDLLQENSMLGYKSNDTPIDSNLKLDENLNGRLVNSGSYQRLVGKLIYLFHTRPNIAYVVSLISQFMHAPHKSHLEIVLRILRYLKSAPRKGLFFMKNNHLHVELYTDSDYGRSEIVNRSTSGYCTFIGGNLVTWRSKKLTVVARSSVEAEFRTMTQGV